MASLLHDESVTVQGLAAGSAGGGSPIGLVQIGELLTNGLGIASSAHGMKGDLSWSSDEASRMLTRPQPRRESYEKTVLQISFNPGGIRSALNVFFVATWQGNDYGEIGAAYVHPAPGASDFVFSDLDVTFEAQKTLPESGVDPRAWPIRFTYNGNFNPLGAGEWDFQGEFEIDAFGSYQHLKHNVDDLTGPQAIGRLDKYNVVQTGWTQLFPPRPLPPDAELPSGAGPAHSGKSGGPPDNGSDH